MRQWHVERASKGLTVAGAAAAFARSLERHRIPVSPAEAESRGGHLLSEL